MFFRNDIDFLIVFLLSEFLIPCFDFLFIQSHTNLKRIDIFDNIFSFIKQIGSSRKHAGELFFTHFLLFRFGLGVFRNQCHNIVIVDNCRRKQNKLKIELFNFRIFILVLFSLLRFQSLCHINISTTERTQGILRQQFLDFFCVFFFNFRVLLQLRFQTLYFLEFIDKFTSCGIAFQVVYLFRFALQSLRFHKLF